MRQGGGPGGGPGTGRRPSRGPGRWALYTVFALLGLWLGWNTWGSRGDIWLLGLVAAWLAGSVWLARWWQHAAGTVPQRVLRRALRRREEERAAWRGATDRLRVGPMGQGAFRRWVVAALIREGWRLRRTSGLLYGFHGLGSRPDGSLVVIQVWHANVPIDRRRVGRLAASAGSRHPILITTSPLTRGAEVLARHHGIEVWDRDRLLHTVR